MPPRDSARVRSQLAELERLSPGVRALLPLLYIAWADGELAPAEISAIKDTIQRQPWLDQPSRAWLNQWLDPKAPPTAATLETLRLTVQTLAAEQGAPRRTSLSDLGVALATDGKADSAALQHIEQTLGLSGVNAAAAFAATAPVEPAR